LPVPTLPEILPSGTLLAGRFQIAHVTHRSARSTVYRALDCRQRRRVVAVKQISVADLPAGEQAETRRWLAREAGLLSALRHPCLPPLIAAFSEGDRHYLVMPYVKGETVEAVVRKSGPLDERDVVHWMRMLADTLVYLHTQNPPIVHRDIKPDNLLLQRDGHMMLLDLGVARPLAPTTVGTAIGTPGFAPPEQYQGLADARSDLYALGATMHCMLTGYHAGEEAPFRYPPIRRLNPAVSMEVEHLVTSMLQLVPAQRPGSAQIVSDQFIALAATRAQGLYARAMWNFVAGAGGLVVLCSAYALLHGLGASFVWAMVPWCVTIAAVIALCASRVEDSRTAVCADALVPRAGRRIGWLLSGLICTCLCSLLGPFAGGWVAIGVFLLSVCLLLSGWLATNPAEDQRISRLAHSRQPSLPQLLP
jgi:hypothetical protein